MAPGTKFSGYEIYVQEPGTKVWMSTGDGWVTVLWPNSAQISSGVGTTERVKYTEIAPLNLRLLHWQKSSQRAADI